MRINNAVRFVGDSFFWLPVGRTWSDRLGLLYYWLSPRLAPLHGVRPHEQMGSPRPFSTIYRDGQPFYLRWNSMDARILRFIFWKKLYTLPWELMEPVSTVVDLGANIGMASLFFADQFPEAQILSVEPDRSSFECLQQNVRPLAESGRLRAVQACVSRQRGSVRFNMSGNSLMRSIVDTSSGGGGVEVPAFSVPDLLEEHGFDQVDLLKMDVEGAEKPILESAQEWLPRIGWMLVEIHFSVMNLPELVELLARSGRQAFYRSVDPAPRWIRATGALPPEIGRRDIGMELLVPPIGWEKQLAAYGESARPVRETVSTTAP